MLKMFTPTNNEHLTGFSRKNNNAMGVLHGKGRMIKHGKEKNK